MSRLTIIKIVHTLIRIFFNVVIFYLLYAVIVNKIDIWVWVCIGLVLMEVVVLLCFKLHCPLTVLARKYSNSTKDNFDIYLPNWLARHNKLIYSAIFLVSIGVLVYRAVT